MRRTKHQLWTAPSILSIFLFAGLCLSGEPEAERDALKEWVRLQSVISAEANQWKAEKEILQDRIALFQAEKKRLRERIREAREGRDEVAEKRAEINAERETLKAVMATVEEPLATYEKRLLELYPTFPDPLQEEVRKLYQRIPKPGETSDFAITERLQAVVGLLNFAEKFNTGVQREAEIRSIDGRQIEVETLYFGLAGAYFSDAQGKHAGVGMPAEDGWQWRETPEAANAIVRMMGVYNGTREAAFSAVPVSVEK